MSLSPVVLSNYKQLTGILHEEEDGNMQLTRKFFGKTSDIVVSALIWELMALFA